MTPVTAQVPPAPAPVREAAPVVASPAAVGASVRPDSSTVMISAPLPSAPATTGRKRDVIAVNDFDGKGVEQSEAALITEQIRTQIIDQRRITVMERSMMDQILKEQGFQQSGSCDGSECQVQVGRLLGVSNLVVGSIGRIGRIYMVNAKLVDVTTGEVLQSVTETCEGTIEDVLRITTQSVARQITRMMIKNQSGILAVKTVPPGAMVRMAGLDMGKTPFVDSLVEPGTHTFQVVLPGWNTETRTVSVSRGTVTSLNVPMERSQEWLAAERKRKQDAIDAQLAQEREQERIRQAVIARRHFIQRLSLGLGGAGAIGIGAWFHHLKDQEDGRAASAYQRYQGLTKQGEIDAAAAEVRDHEKKASNNSLYRNICWGVGGALLASISLTFLF